MKQIANMFFGGNGLNAFSIEHKVLKSLQKVHEGAIL
jgi:hypothetical protein